MSGHSEVSPATADDLRLLVNIEEAVSMQKYPNPELDIASYDDIALNFIDYI